MKYYLCLALMLATVVFFGQSNTVIVIGKVIDSSGSPLRDAVVKLFKANDSVLINGAIADSFGKFYFSSVEIGEYTIKVSYTGYATGTLTKYFQENADLGDIRLENQVKMLEVVSVVARARVIEQKIDMTVINVTETIRNETTNALDILKLAPGVQITDNDDNVQMIGKEGVIVLINNKSSRLTERELLNLLKSISSDMVSQIEIISNPSSKYGLDGRKGVVNIRIKRNYEVGVNGNFAAEWARAVNDQSNANISLNYGAKNLAIFGYVGYNWGAYQTKQISNRLATAGSRNWAFDNDYVGQEKWKDPNLRIGADYKIGKRSLLGLIVEWENSENRANYSNKSKLRIRDNISEDSLIYTLSNSPYRRNWTTVNLNYQYIGKKNFEFNVDLDNSLYRNTRDNQVDNYFGDNSSNLIELNLYSLQASINISTSKFDFTKKFENDSKFEGGIKNTSIDIANSFESRRSKGNVPLTDSSISNNYDYRENIRAGYLNFSREINNWAFQVGLRVEQTDVEGNSTFLNGGKSNRPDSSYWSYLPSGYVSYNSGENHSFRLSFVRNLKRPNYGVFQPFVYQYDIYRYYIGNPFLVPQSTSNLEFAYTYKGEYSINLSYARVDNFMSAVLFQNSPILYESSLNLGKYNSLNLEINAPLKITNWWSLKNRITITHDEYIGQMPFGYFSGQRISFGANITQRFKLPYKIIAQVSAWYTSPTIRLFYTVNSIGSVNAYVGRKILKDKATVKLGASDVFFTQIRKTTIDVPGFYQFWNQSFESRNIYIQFSYRFGKKKILAARERDTGNLDEKDRSSK